MSLLNHNLKAFVAVVNTGTVHAAATQLRLTQTAVTQRIRSIETELNTTLFTRSRKGMILTQEGQSLLRYCLGAIELEGKALSSISKAGLDQLVHLSLVGPTSVMTSRILPQLIPLYARWPNLYLNLIISDTDDRLGLLKSGKVQFAILPPEVVVNELESKSLKPDRYLLVASSKWKSRRLTDILEHEKIIDFYESDQTTINYLKKFDLIKKIKNPRLFINNNEALIRAIIAGIGFGTLTQEVAKKFIENEDLIIINNGAILDDALALAWYERHEPPKYFDEIIKLIK